jgi:hypothetical protein
MATSGLGEVGSQKWEIGSRKSEDQMDCSDGLLDPISDFLSDF